MEWARLLRQVFAVDVLRCPCGGERNVIAALTRNHSPEALRRYLEHMGEPVDPPPSSSDCGEKVLSGIADVAIGHTPRDRADDDGIYRDSVPHASAFDVARVNSAVPAGFAISVDLAGATHATMTRSDAMPPRVIAQREEGSRFLFVFFQELSPGESVTIEPHP